MTRKNPIVAYLDYTICKDKEKTKTHMKEYIKEIENSKERK
jgi:hypothetical protein